MGTTAPSGRTLMKVGLERLEGVSLEVKSAGITSDSQISDQGYVFSLSSSVSLELPDVLVYWSSAASPSIDGELPSDAVLLGSFRGGSTGSYLASSIGDTLTGTLILYSLGHSEIVDAQSLQSSAGVQ